jgi:sodium-coupled neutral amino acid transporter 11
MTQTKGPHVGLVSGTPKKQTTVQTSSVPALTANLVKAIVGCGALSLPTGVASFSDIPSVGLTVGVSIATALAFATGYSFWLIGRMCHETGCDTYAKAFGQIFGESAAKALAGLVGISCFALCDGYTITIADTARDLGIGLGFSGILTNRNAMVTIITFCILLPVSMLRSLAALAPFSILGIIGICMAAMVTVVRFVGADYAPGGQFYDKAPAEPSFDESGTHSIVALVLVSILATSYNAHFCAGRFWAELDQPTTKRFGLLTFAGFFFSWFIMVGLMVFGYLTFGGASQSYILNNYATNDVLAMMARIGVFASMLFSFPILTQAARDFMLEMCTPSPSQGQKDVAAVSITIFALCVALAMDDLGFLMALSGSIAGSATVYIFPAAMFLKAKPSNATKIEVIMNWVLLTFGIVSAVLGAMIVIVQKFQPELLA